jgi:hypothetical protein
MPAREPGWNSKLPYIVISDTSKVGTVRFTLDMEYQVFHSEPIPNKVGSSNGYDRVLIL